VISFFIIEILKKRYDILYDSGTYGACVACGRWGDMLKQMKEECHKTHGCWDLHCNGGFFFHVFSNAGVFSKNNGEFPARFTVLRHRSWRMSTRRRRVCRVSVWFHEKHRVDPNSKNLIETCNEKRRLPQAQAHICERNKCSWHGHNEAGMSVCSDYIRNPNVSFQLHVPWCVPRIAHRKALKCLYLS